MTASELRKCISFKYRLTVKDLDDLILILVNDEYLILLLRTMIYLINYIISLILTTILLLNIYYISFNEYYITIYILKNESYTRE